MQENMSLAEQLTNCVLLNYSGTVDNQFMKTINAISEDVTRFEAWNSEMVNCIIDLMNYVDATELVKSTDAVYQNLINTMGR